MCYCVCVVWMRQMWEEECFFWCGSKYLKSKSLWLDLGWCKRTALPLSYLCSGFCLWGCILPIFITYTWPCVNKKYNTCHQGYQKLRPRYYDWGLSYILKLGHVEIQGQDSWKCLDALSQLLTAIFWRGAVSSSTEDGSSRPTISSFLHGCLCSRVRCLTCPRPYRKNRILDILRIAIWVNTRP